MALLAAGRAGGRVQGVAARRACLLRGAPGRLHGAGFLWRPSGTAATAQGIFMPFAQAQAYASTRRPRKAKQSMKLGANNRMEVLKKNLNQFLRHTHPDALRRHVERETAETQEEYDLHAVLQANEESIQHLNAFVQTMTHYKDHTRDFIAPKEPVTARFFIVRREQEDRPGILHVREIACTLRLPNMEEEEWMRKTGGRNRECMMQWRDAHLLDLLSRAQDAFSAFDDAKLRGTKLLPTAEQLEFLRSREKVTRIPLPAPFSARKPKVEPEEDDDFESTRKRGKGETNGNLFMDLPEGNVDSEFIKCLRTDLEMAGRSRGDPTNLVNRKYGREVIEPNQKELDECVDALGIFFPVATPQEIQEKVRLRLRKFAREFRLHEWYTLPLYVGAPTYSSTYKDGFLCVPWNFTAKETLAFLRTEMKYVQHRQKCLQERLQVVVDQCEAIMKDMEIRMVDSTKEVGYPQLQDCLARLSALSEKRETDTSAPPVRLRGVFLKVHGLRNYYHFDEVTGELSVPHNWSVEALDEAIAKNLTALQTFKMNFKLLPDLPDRLRRNSINFKQVIVDPAIANCVTYQTHAMGRLLEHRRLFSQFNLSFLTLRISTKFSLDSEARVLSIPHDFSITDFVGFLEEFCRRQPGDVALELLGQA